MGGSSPLSLIPVIDAPGDLVGPISINAADQYTERVSYDKNSNITSIERYGMNNQRHYGLIDSLVITRNGNQLKTIEDYAEKDLTYTGASDFYDGYTYDTEYYYNANGALESDINRDIDLIQYDALGNTRCIYYFGQNQIEYVYAADGTKLRTIHRPSSSTALTDSIDYIGNLVLKNGQPSMYLFDGGYATFNQNGAVDGWHYYIQDYMGNNRMVVNKTGTVEQVTHYYPYGGVIGDISTNESHQPYKFEGKELDRTFGLDNYDIHARQYFAMMPSWDRIDPMAEKYYGISPYVYCGGDPVNRMDLNGDTIIIVGNIYDVIMAITNGIPDNTNLSLRLTNGIIDPSSIPDSDDPFLQDLKMVSSAKEMVEIGISHNYEYEDDYGNINLYDFASDKLPVNCFDDADMIKTNNEWGLPSGRSVSGDTGRSLFPNSNTGRKSPNGKLRIVINAYGTLNHRTIGIGHELIHIVCYLQGKPYLHTSRLFQDYFEKRMKPLLNRLGYDY